MSYHLYLYPSEVKAFIRAGGSWEDAKVAAMRLPADILPPLRERLERRGYQSEGTPNELTKMFGTVPVTVRFHTQSVAFSAPYWDGLGDILFDWRMEVIELTDVGGIHLFDPQGNEWDFGIED